jgi:hypothetical protein
MSSRLLRLTQILTVALLLSIPAVERAYAQEKCDAWITEILADPDSPLNNEENADISLSNDCAPLVDELWARQYLSIIKPELFSEAKLAFSVARECDIQHTKDAVACTAKGSNQSCPPSDECNAVWERHNCIFSEAKAYEIQLNKLNERKAARELVDELSEEKCIGDESRTWDVIRDYWESLKQIEQEAE